MLFEAQRKEVIKAGTKLDRYGLIALSGGNVSMRLPNGDILVTPSGMIYEEMVPEDILLIDLQGNVIEGNRRASVDTEALLYIFRHMPQVGAVIHTHQPYATAVGLVTDELPCCLTTLANATHGSVKVCPYASAASIDMGIQTVEYASGKLAVILKNHGVISLGADLNQALYACVYLEEGAKTYIAARSMSCDIALLTPDQIDAAIDVFKNYGQKQKG